MTATADLASARTAALDYLSAMEDRRLDDARRHVGPGVSMIFPGGRTFASVEEIAASSGGRYAEVRKTVERSESWHAGTRIAVLVTGTLYGRWADGEAFDGIRFADRFEFENGRIVRQEVWNDAGERRLARAGIGETAGAGAAR
ncbi:nuclear transport factor 2 family protein [Stappia indica]|uniref:Nuclear transport factor 2 family protein n=1 Tax=Stappia indica TaxID=538381 RepID=A0A857CAH6_9HYPH|nr:nuclear transport factor 2 family protein [Stappia indica]QGZ35875.1 nuclear transport factor 2 family protein [Stappia indica]